MEPRIFPIKISLSINIYARNNLRSAEWIFMKSDMAEFYYNLLSHFLIHSSVNQHDIKAHMHILCTFWVKKH